MGLEPGVKEDKTKPIENESVMARRSVTNTARRRRGTDFSRSRDSFPMLRAPIARWVKMN